MPMSLSRRDEPVKSTDISSGTGLNLDEIKLKAVETPAKCGPEDAKKDRRANALAFIDIISVMFQSSVPTVISWGLSMGLIFGGCCSNVGCPTAWCSLDFSYAREGLCFGSNSEVSVRSVIALPAIANGMMLEKNREVVLASFSLVTRTYG